MDTSKTYLPGMIAAIGNHVETMEVMVVDSPTFKFFHRVYGRRYRLVNELVIRKATRVGDILPYVKMSRRVDVKTVTKGSRVSLFPDTTSFDLPYAPFRFNAIVWATGKHPDSLLIMANFQEVTVDSAASMITIVDAEARLIG